jgi:hypothetical protein
MNKNESYKNDTPYTSLENIEDADTIKPEVPKTKIEEILIFLNCSSNRF